MIDEQTIVWRERFEEKNSNDHRKIYLTLANLDKNIALMTREVRVLANDTKDRTDALQTKVEKNCDRVLCLEKYKNTKVTQLKMLNWLVIGVGAIVGVLVSFKELLFGGR